MKKAVITQLLKTVYKVIVLVQILNHNSSKVSRNNFWYQNNLSNNQARNYYKREVYFFLVRVKTTC